MTHANYALPPAATVLSLDGEGGARPMDLAEVGGGRPDGGPHWIELDQAREQDWAWLESESGLRDDDVQLFRDEETWPRVRTRGPDRIFLVTRLLSAESGATLAFDALRCWIEPQCLITMSKAGQPHLAAVKETFARGAGPSGIGGILLAVTEFTADQLADDVMDLLRLSIVDTDTAGDQGALRAQLVRVRRRAVMLERFADPQRALLIRLRSHDLRWLMTAEADDWRVVLDNYEQVSREIDAAAEHSRILQESLTARTNEQINRRIALLTLVSMVFLPLSLIAGLFGVNISTENGNIFGLDDPLWFVGLSSAVAILGASVYTLLRHWWRM